MHSKLVISTSNPLTIYWEKINLCWLSILIRLKFRLLHLGSNYNSPPCNKNKFCLNRFQHQIFYSHSFVWTPKQINYIPNLINIHCFGRWTFFKLLFLPVEDQPVRGWSSADILSNYLYTYVKVNQTYTTL